MRILVTAGPTREYFDPVRYLSNASSGRLGYAIAAAGVARGHQVLLISGPVELPPPSGVELVRIVSAAEMLDVCVRRFPECDAAVMAAAVCDYRPVHRMSLKLKRTQAELVLRLEPTVDICATLGRNKEKRIVIGFALEDHDGHVSAKAKLHDKHCDAIVLNAPSTIGAETATIQIYHRKGRWDAPRHGSKDDLAFYLIRTLEQLQAEQSDRPNLNNP